ncbi:hypothetical protein EV1_023649 [Malus domestica]
MRSFEHLLHGKTKTPSAQRDSCCTALILSILTPSSPAVRPSPRGQTPAPHNARQAAAIMPNQTTSRQPKEMMKDFPLTVNASVASPPLPKKTQSPPPTTCHVPIGPTSLPFPRGDHFKAPHPDFHFPQFYSKLRSSSSSWTREGTAVPNFSRTRVSLGFDFS